ncbi:hypothetical protein PSTG_17393 [Puccinia striiformis f. sp. tritici PST-78]|uniref:Uncharacterized protein n=1 Tax=Puccinia striiformis f. sp. tritici PST-78 TaxID=1165861 RepID=A0A0L0UQA3_9BASI|nr:hypothetical protein PSTG_17393 [Puccinia striiformis f. sp. tritici PST-78]
MVSVSKSRIELGSNIQSRSLEIGSGEHVISLIQFPYQGERYPLVIFYPHQSPWTIVFCHGFQPWPLNLLALGKDHNDQNSQDGEILYNQVTSSQGLTLLAIIAVEDPLEPGVTEAVTSCARAGVAVKIVTVDSFITVMQFGIYNSCGIIMGASVHTDILHLHRFNIMCYSGNLPAFVLRVSEDKTTSSWLYKNNSSSSLNPHIWIVLKPKEKALMKIKKVGFQHPAWNTQQM